MRFLQLSTPLMHGHDVGVLQTALKDKHGQSYIKVDEQFGPLTKHAVGVVATAMGLDVYVATPYAQRIIEGIERRTPAQVLRAKQRAEAAKKAGQGLAAVLVHAKRFVGVTEHPAGSNGGDPEPGGWIRDCGYVPGTSAENVGPPWCCMFYSSMVGLAGGHVPQGEDSGYVPEAVGNAKAGLGGYEQFVPWNGQHSLVTAGWGVAYAWDGSHEGGDHIEVFDHWISASEFATVGGNTSSDNSGDQSNGGGVFARTRSIVDVVGFVKPRIS